MKRYNALTAERQSNHGHPMPEMGRGRRTRPQINGAFDNDQV